jgi:hypothetical protein
MDELVWTTKLPTVPGWYWFHPERFPDRRYWQIIEVHSGDIERGIYAGIDNVWAGPIPEPKENHG